MLLCFETKSGSINYKTRSASPKARSVQLGRPRAMTDDQIAVARSPKAAGELSSGKIADLTLEYRERRCIGRSASKRLLTKSLWVQGFLFPMAEKIGA